MQRNFRRPLVGLSLALALTVSAACGGSDKGSAEDGGVDEITFVVPSAVVGPKEEFVAAVAEGLGYFKDESLKVEVKSADGSTAAVQLLASGTADVASADATAVAAAVQQGVPVKVFSGNLINWPYQIATLSDGPIQSVADLDGKSLGVISLSSGSVPFADGALKAAGLKSGEDVTLKPVGVGPTAISALKSGQVAALALYGSVYTEIEDAGVKLKYFDNPPIFDPLFSVSMTASTKTLKNDPDVLERFSRAYFKAVLYSAINPEDSLKIAYKKYPEALPAGGVESGLNTWTTHLKSVTPPGEPEEWADSAWGELNAERWEKLIEYNLDAGFLEGDVPVADVWDDSLVSKIFNFDRKAVIAAAKEGGA